MALRQTQRPSFHCTLSELVELAVISCLWTRFESDEGVALRQTQGPSFHCTLSELVKLAAISCSGTGCQSGVWRSRGKIIFPPITFILCESRESRNTSSKEKADSSSAVLTLTHISFRAGCVSDGCTHSFIRN